MSSAADWFNNLAQGFPGFGEGYQYNQARLDADAAVQLAQQEGMTLHIVGHSLGGGMATAAALHTGVPATTFNAAGVNWLTTDLSMAADLITNYRVRGEILSTMQDTALLGWTMPNSSAGITYWLTPNSDDVGLLGILNRHRMGRVLEAMESLF